MQTKEFRWLSEKPWFFNPPFCLQKGGWSSEATTGWVKCASDVNAKGMGEFTHPECAVLFDPPSAVRKEGEENFSQLDNRA